MRSKDIDFPVNPDQNHLLIQMSNRGVLPQNWNFLDADSKFFNFCKKESPELYPTEAGLDYQQVEMNPSVILTCKTGYDNIKLEEFHV